MWLYKGSFGVPLKYLLILTFLSGKAGKYTCVFIRWEVYILNRGLIDYFFCEVLAQ